MLKVYPGIVDTEFRNHVLAGAAPPEVKRIGWVVSPDVVASRIHRGIERRDRMIFGPRIGRWFAMADAVAPWLMDLYLSRYMPPAPFLSLPQSRPSMTADRLTATPKD